MWQSASHIRRRSAADAALGTVADRDNILLKGADDYSKRHNKANAIIDSKTKARSRESRIRINNGRKKIK